MDVPARTGMLRVDLSAGTVESERVPEAWRRTFLGGKGLGARYLYEELSPGVDPLGPENVLAFMLGPLSGYLPGDQRYAAITRSPLTGTFLDSYSGGSFPGTLAGSLGGHLGVLVTGRADEPVALLVEDGDARIEPTDAWGDDTVETCDAYDGAVACVGPAGEQGVAYATIASDRGDHHAGRGGAGAVMGAKRLKAVVACGMPPELTPELERLHERDEEAFAGGDTARAYWIYSFRRGAYYPFAPRGGTERDHGLEFKLRSVLEGELDVEADEAYWYPLWPDAEGGHPWD